MAKVTFLPDNKECNSPNNVTLLEVAKRNNFNPLVNTNKKIPYLVDQHLLEK